MSAYKPPEDIWEVNSRLQLDEVLDGDKDPRWVDTDAARGESSVQQLRRTLGVHPSRRELKAPERGYYLFCGHRGSGKSTELRRMRNDLHDPRAYYVVFADATQELDVNNLRYQDILLHLAHRPRGATQGRPPQRRRRTPQETSGLVHGTSRETGTDQDLRGRSQSRCARRRGPSLAGEAVLRDQCPRSRPTPPTRRS